MISLSSSFSGVISNAPLVLNGERIIICEQSDPPNPYPVELDLVRGSDLLIEFPFYFTGSSGLVIGAFGRKITECGPLIVFHDLTI